jgi:hypothetical protein
MDNLVGGHSNVPQGGEGECLCGFPERGSKEGNSFLFGLLASAL